MIRKEPIAIANSSKGQINPAFLGNIPTPLYQQSALYVQNAILNPEGSTKKRPGTRYICPAFPGPGAKLFSHKGRVFVLGTGFLHIIEGLNIVTATRTTPPHYNNGVFYEVYPSDVLVSKSGNAMSFHNGTPATPLTPIMHNYFKDRYNEKIDTYLHSNANRLTGFDNTPTQTDLSVINTVPDLTQSGTFTTSTTFPFNAPVHDGTIEALLKVPHNYPFDQLHLLHFTLTQNIGSFMPMSNSHFIYTLNANNPTYTPDNFTADVIHDYRIRKIRPISTNHGLTFYGNNIDVTTPPVNNNYSQLLPNGFGEIVTTTMFQGRFAIFQYDANKQAQLVLSNVGMPTTFQAYNNNPRAADALLLNIDAFNDERPTIMAPFNNVLIIGTEQGIYTLNGVNGHIERNGGIDITKISDFGVANSEPILHTGKLYLVGNDRQSMIQLVKNPYGLTVDSQLVPTYSDSLRVNGYIKKLVAWQWEHQFIGAVMSDGCFLKANLDSDNINFNQWIFDKDTVLDVLAQTTTNQEDTLYFIIERNGIAQIEVMFANQMVQKHYHSYSVFQPRSLETEKHFQYTSKIRSHYVKNATHCDSAVTLDTKLPNGITFQIQGNTLTVTGNKNDLFPSDQIKYKNYEALQIEAQTSSNPESYLVRGNTTNWPSNFGSSDLVILRKIWPFSKYPILDLFKDKHNVSICGDGNNFLLSRYDDFNEVIEVINFLPNGNLVLNSYHQEITIGFTYRFTLITTPIVSPYSPNASKPKILNPVQFYLRNTHVINVGTQPDKLDTKRTDRYLNAQDCFWFDAALYNNPDDGHCPVIIQSDHATPVEIISINLEYAL